MLYFYILLSTGSVRKLTGGLKCMHTRLLYPCCNDIKAEVDSLVNGVFSLAFKLCRTTQNCSKCADNRNSAQFRECPRGPHQHKKLHEIPNWLLAPHTITIRNYP